jgi:hypothetical protein
MQEIQTAAKQCKTPLRQRKTASLPPQSVRSLFQHHDEKEAKRRKRLEIARSAERDHWKAISKLIGGKSRRKGIPRDTAIWNCDEHKSYADELAALFHSISEIDSAPSFKVETFLENNFPIFPKFSEWEIQRTLLKPQLKSSPGEDKIPVSILRDLWQRHSSTMTEMFNKALQNFPAAWKRALISPIPKVGGGHRPIALLSQMGKILERGVNWKAGQVLQVATDQFSCRNSVAVDLVIYKFHNFSIPQEGE